nr:glycoside hydrolase family 16 protein [Blastococcus haudaquaticus]
MLPISPGFADEFDGPDLDRSVWLPHYLPAWSSRAATAAAYELRDGCLHLSIPADQGLWLPGEHEPPLRVSGIQSGNFSGPVGSTVGQQPWRAGAVVCEEQETFWGWTPDHGRLEMRARAQLTPRSMAAWWLVGLEDVPERCAEICVFEVFGDAVEPGTSAAVGMGLHAFRDPDAPEDFAASGCRSTSRSSTPTPSTGPPSGRSSPSTAPSSGAAPARRPTRCS